MGSNQFKATTVTFRDVRGFTAVHRYYVDNHAGDPTPADALAIFLKLGALSTAFLEKASGAYTTPPGPIGYGTGATYASVFDKAVMVFSDQYGQLYRYRIPAPSRDLFLADGETIDVVQADVQDWATTMLAHQAVGKTGERLTSFRGGLLERKTRPRRLSIYSIDPNLVGSGW